MDQRQQDCAGISVFSTIKREVWKEGRIQESYPGKHVVCPLCM